MTNPTVRGRFLLLLVFPRSINKRCGPLRRRSIATHYLEVCFMWKMHCKLAGSIPAWTRSIRHVAKTRKQESCGIARRYCDVAIRTDSWRRSLACEELLAVAVQAGCVFRKLRYIWKRGVAFTDFFPVGTGELVARITCEFLFSDVRRMREVGVINARTCASLSRGRSTRNSETDYYKCN